MKAVVRVRRGKSWRYVVRGTTDPTTGCCAYPYFVMLDFMSGLSPDVLAEKYATDRLTIEQVIREARGSRWWRE